MVDAIDLSFHADCQGKGTAWAYELAEQLVLHCRYLGLFPIHLPMTSAKSWHGAILGWTKEEVAEAEAWRDKCPYPPVKPPTPAIIERLLLQTQRTMGIETIRFS